MLQRNDRDKENVYACACVLLFLFAWSVSGRNIRTSQRRGASGERNWATREQRKQDFSLYNSTLLLNFEPCKYIAIKKNGKKKPLQGCSPWFSHLEKYPWRLWRKCLWGLHCGRRGAEQTARGNGLGARAAAEKVGRRDRSPGAELIRHLMDSLLDNFKAC